MSHTIPAKNEIIHKSVDELKETANAIRDT